MCPFTDTVYFYLLSLLLYFEEYMYLKISGAQNPYGNSLRHPRLAVRGSGEAPTRTAVGPHCPLARMHERSQRLHTPKIGLLRHGLAPTRDKLAPVDASCAPDAAGARTMRHVVGSAARGAAGRRARAAPPPAPSGARSRVHSA